MATLLRDLLVLRKLHMKMKPEKKTVLSLGMFQRSAIGNLKLIASNSGPSVRKSLQITTIFCAYLRA